MIARTALRRRAPALRAAFLGRDARLADDDRRLADYQSAPPPESPTAPQSVAPQPSPRGPSPASPPPRSPSPRSLPPHRPLR